MNSLRWTGRACLGSAVVMLGTQIYVYLSAGLVSAWLLGGGVGLLLLGLVASFHSLDDKRTRNATLPGDLPTADEYDRKLEMMPDENVNQSQPHD